ncbi:MAG: signal peptidase I [Desulfobacterales bacterium]
MKKDKKKETGEASSSKGALRENIEAIIIAVIIALFIRTFVVQAFKIPSGSMKQTLLIGDHILVNKFIYGVKLPFNNMTVIPGKAPQRGDVVVFQFPEDKQKDFIKRVIGTPGDVIEIRDKVVYVNGKRLNHDFGIHSDPHVFPAGMQPRDNFGPVKVPDNALFVMGDNRDQSYDSRFWGFVDMDAVKGEAFIIYWSWDSKDFGVRWSRLGDLIR